VSRLATGGALLVLLAACATRPEPAPAPAEEAPGKMPAVEGPTRPPEPEPEPEFLPPAGATQHFAGVSGLRGGKRVFVLVTRTCRAGADPARRTFTRVVREGARLDATKESGRESYVAELRDDGIWVALPPDRARDVPAPVRELPLPVEAGKAWETRSAGVRRRCRVDAVETAASFEGPQEGCAVVSLRDDAGSLVTRRWHHPERGVVRTEVRDASGRLVFGLALCGSEPPAESELLAAFAISSPSRRAR
jgi:hypothetical protein